MLVFGGGFDGKEMLHEVAIVVVVVGAGLVVVVVVANTRLAVVVVMAGIVVVVTGAAVVEVVDVASLFKAATSASRRAVRWSPLPELQAASRTPPTATRATVRMIFMPLTMRPGGARGPSSRMTISPRADGNAHHDLASPSATPLPLLPSPNRPAAEEASPNGVASDLP